MFECDTMKENGMKKADRILIAVVLLAAVLCSILFLGMNRKVTEGYALVEQDGAEIMRLPLSEDTSVQIDCDSGYNVVTVQDGQVSVTQADCPDQICVRQGSIQGSYESITCLPHKMVVRLIGFD